MPKVLLIGASGFIAAHVLQILLERGYDVVATVRSQAKAEAIRDAPPDLDRGNLTFAIVDDISKPDAFDKAVVSDPPIDAVIHTASPFQLKISSPEDFMAPAVNGTVGILKSIKKYAPTVRSVVVTSSFAAIIDTGRPKFSAGYTYSEKDWNPTTLDKVMEDPSDALEVYRASKTIAEQSAWRFLETEKPNFSLATICPPLVFGPVPPFVKSLADVNTSNHIVRSIVTGAWTSQIAETYDVLFVDVRDVAECHVRAIERPAAANKRFFIPAGYACNKDIVEIIRDHFPDLKEYLPAKETPGGGYPVDGLMMYDNTRARNVLGVEFRTLSNAIRDTVKSMKHLAL